jgi:predicted acylesterase/phospholipase RssA
MEPFRGEHRLAVVMNGGVSLAVWMGGLARELDNVRRASRGLPLPEGEGPQAEAERALAIRWAELTAGTPVVVDVVAGTSAGGLNGVLLAMAAAYGRPLGDLRGLWMRTAQLSTDALLAPQGSAAASVLSGDHFLRELTGYLQQLGSGDHDPAAGADVVLTVTSTALRGGPRRVADSYGSLFTEPDHRRRFEFRRVGEQVRYAPGEETTFPSTERNDFADTDAVALAGRASASFPVAFAPVPESAALRRFRRWPTWATGPDLEWLADGGILDNSPFEPVLRAISDQPVTGRWRRTLCYVVPSASEGELGRGIAEPPRTGAGRPPPWTSVLQSALFLPREADLRDDVEQIHEVIRSGRSSYDARRFRLLVASPDGLLDQGRRLASAGFPLYREARLGTGVYQVLDATARPERFISSAGEVLPSDVRELPRQWLPDAFPTALPERWTWGLAAAKRTVAVLLRSLADDDEVPDGLRVELSRVKREVAAVDAAVGQRLAEADLGVLPGPDSVRAAAALADDTFAALAVPEVLGGLLRAAVAAYARDTLGDESQAFRVLEAALCVEVVNGAGGLPVETRSRPLFDFVRMGVSQTPRRFARAFAAAQADAAGDADVLYGTRLGHFAAFGLAAWREWDWLWGRLHAVMHLGRLLDLEEDVVDELLGLVLAAEGTTPEEVEAGVAAVFAAREADLLDEMRAAGIFPPAADAVLALLGSSLETEPRMPDAVRRLGGLTASLAGRRPVPGRWVVRGARVLVAPLRRRWWRSLGSD